MSCSKCDTHRKRPEPAESEAVFKLRGGIRIPFRHIKWAEEDVLCFLLSRAQPLLTFVVSKQPQTSGGLRWKSIQYKHSMSDYFMIWDAFLNGIGFSEIYIFFTFVMWRRTFWRAFCKLYVADGWIMSPSSGLIEHKKISVKYRMMTPPISVKIVK